MMLKLKLMPVMLVASTVIFPAWADPVEPTMQELTVPKALRLLQSQGYYDFRKIKVERDEHEIEIEARNADGLEVEIELDLFSGKVLAVERD